MRTIGQLDRAVVALNYSSMDVAMFQVVFLSTWPNQYRSSC